MSKSPAPTFGPVALDGAPIGTRTLVCHFVVEPAARTTPEQAVRKMLKSVLRFYGVHCTRIYIADEPSSQEGASCSPS